MIPKQLMQTWKTHDLPNEWQSSPGSFKALHFNWKYTLMSDHDNKLFIQQHMPHLYLVYQRLPYNIQRADMIRYVYLYVNGGFYCDCDAKFIKKLDFLCDNDLIISRNQLGCTNAPSNWFLASTKNHPFWLLCLEEVSREKPFYIFGKHNTVMYTTGSWMIKRAIDRYRKPYRLLPHDFITCNLQGQKHQSNNTCIEPLQGQSWITWDTKFYHLIFRLRYPLFALIIVFIVRFCIFGVREVINWKRSGLVYTR